MKKNNWVYKVFLWTFILSTIFSFSTNYLSSHASIVVMILIILLVIAIGIIFDMIGASSLTSKQLGAADATGKIRRAGEKGASGAGRGESGSP